MLQIVTDGAADMPAGWEKEYDIQVIPINIQFGERTYLQGVDLSNEDFYRLVEESGKIPKTSQPSPFQFKEFYESVAKAGDTILSVHVTSKLSGTFESAVTAARELGDKFNIFPFDSGAGSAALGMMCREARLMERAGTATQQIIERMMPDPPQCANRAHGGQTRLRPHERPGWYTPGGPGLGTQRQAHYCFAGGPPGCGGAGADTQQSA
jgi:DegV family protein with EDD domain